MTKPPGQRRRQDRLPDHLLGSLLEDARATLNVRYLSVCGSRLTDGSLLAPVGGDRRSIHRIRLGVSGLRVPKNKPKKTQKDTFSIHKLEI